MALLKSKIVVVPMGEVDFMLVNKLASNVGPVFNRSVDILKGMKMPEEAYNVIRNQYYAQVILSKIERTKANSREKVIAICEEDLYLPDETLRHGLGATGCPARRWYRCIVSGRSSMGCRKTRAKCIRGCSKRRCTVWRICST